MSEHPSMDELISELQESLCATERLLNVRLTVVDVGFLFQVKGSIPILGYDRHSHKKNDACRIGFCSLCIDHCRVQMSRQARNAPRPFSFHCWKGLKEIVTPMVWKGHHVGNLFAGNWRHPESEGTPAHLGPDMAEAWHALPLLDDKREQDLCRCLPMVAEAICSTISRVLPLDVTEHSRRGVMKRFFHHAAYAPVSLADLGYALHLSPSRAGHLVREVFGESFQQLVLAHRMERACDLLRTTELNNAEVARQIGMPSVQHFVRTFRREFGMPPGTYRKSRQNQKNGPHR